MKSEKKNHVDMLGAALYNMPRANALKQIQEPAQQLPLEQTSKLEPAHQNQTEDLFAAFMKPQGPQPPIQDLCSDLDRVKSVLTVRRSRPVPQLPLPQDQCHPLSRFRQQENDLIESILVEIKEGMIRNEKIVSKLKKKQTVRLKP